ncbi:sulfotransferase family protein [Roseiconus lacunae]|uniref:Sulfotransferase n=1 Tax=Roseiconus lacunae TaxID=2605694 RepID=A0ABT7PR86_9BACT|nr:sulfotransferase [Roseiconus lacunae]MDM4018851.1 sulfotransferase [Roseiconus lacunae]
MTTNIPNLFVIGAMKCGTTTLHNLLAEHPDIFMSAEKEPAFFTIEHPTDQQRYHYQSLFQAADGERVLGESSTQYSMLPTYPGCINRLADASPNAKLIYMMKDPIERTLSHYWHQYRSKKRHGGDRRPIIEAVLADEHYHAVSDYARQLKPYLDRFGRNQIKAVVLERFSQNPEEGYQDILQFLGVDPDFTPERVGRRDHDGQRITARKRKWLTAIQRSSQWDAVRSFVPAPIRRIGHRLSEYDRVDRRAFDDSAARKALLPHALRWTNDLEQLLGEDLGLWRRKWESLSVPVEKRGAK